MAPLETKVIFQAPIFHFHDYGRKGTPIRLGFFVHGSSFRIKAALRQRQGLAYPSRPRGVRGWLGHWSGRRPGVKEGV